MNDQDETSHSNVLTAKIFRNPVNFIDLRSVTRLDLVSITIQLIILVISLVIIIIISRREVTDQRVVECEKLCREGQPLAGCTNECRLSDEFSDEVELDCRYENREIPNVISYGSSVSTKYVPHRLTIDGFGVAEQILPGLYLTYATLPSCGGVRIIYNMNNNTFEYALENSECSFFDEKDFDSRTLDISDETFRIDTSSFSPSLIISDLESESREFAVMSDLKFIKRPLIILIQPTTVTIELDYGRSYYGKIIRSGVVQNGFNFFGSTIGYISVSGIGIESCNLMVIRTTEEFTYEESYQREKDLVEISQVIMTVLASMITILNITKSINSREVHYDTNKELRSEVELRDDNLKSNMGFKEKHDNTDDRFES
jgi:hypothetical protein